MTEIYQVFKSVAENYGETAAISLLVLGGVIYGVYLLTKNISGTLNKYLEKKLLEESETHTKATLHRKTITPEVRKHLSDLALETCSDRAMLFEFSNGTSNLVGLPFLYASATCEVMKTGVAPVSQLYQKVNTSLIAEFLEKLEELGYFYIEDLESIKDTHAVLYNFMKPNGVKCALFYSLYGVKDTIGFLVVSTTKDHSFTRKDALPKVAGTAQLISSLLNFDEISKELE